MSFKNKVGFSYITVGYDIYHSTIANSKSKWATKAHLVFWSFSEEMYIKPNSKYYYFFLINKIDF